MHANIAADQAAIALTWHHDPADLPALAELTLAPASNPLSYRWINLPYALHRGYGDAAIPYLETMLARSQFIWVRTDAARELAIAGRAAGFAFIAQAIEHNERYKGEMLQFIRDSFPGMRNADERAVLRYVKERATAVTSSAGK